jgi:16S rRNA (cytidine1402-2'-O)-methyltransferase
MKTEPTLFIVPTPIGNLGDITLRALQVLKTVDIILAEDTRTSKKLLQHYDIRTPLESFHAFNEHEKLAAIVERLKNQTKMALISDAGTPGISDPGYLLVRQALQHRIEVECLPGPTAFVPALIQSGLPTQRFVFEGFLPLKKGRQALLKKLAEEERTVILYESPHRLLKTLCQLAEFFGRERPASISRELTKLYAETIHATLGELITLFSGRTIKGELVIVVAGKKFRPTDQPENTSSV